MNANSAPTVKISTALLGSVIVLEIAYLYLRTTLKFANFFPGLTVIEQELVRSGLRALILAGVFLACWHFKSIPNFFRKPDFNRTTLFLLAALFIQAVMDQSHHVTGPAAQLTFAATTTLVAIREELEYRYVIQNWLAGWLAPKASVFGAILITSMLFTFSHLGAQPISHFPSIFIASLLLGAIYHHSGKSISLVIVCHFIFDLFYI